MHTACRVVDKAWQRGLKVWVWAEDSDDLQSMDDLLWTFRQGSFVPHERLAGQEPRAPVCIGTPEEARESGQLLINLTGEVPAFAEQFTRIAEIVDTDEGSRTASRKRFRRYREMGIEPVTHNI